jgi:hypothetical protein
MKRLIVIAAAVLVAGCATVDGWTGWTTLVDGGGKGLENFDRLGDANWRVEDGALVADKATENSYLVTRESYRDFKIHAEFWADTTTNSGVFVRVTNPKKVGSDSSYEVNIYDLRPGPEYGTGAIVGVAKVPVPTLYKAVGKWNTFDITAKGDNLVVVLNGVKTVDVMDNKFPQGRIALQYGLHGKVPGEIIKWRKVQVKPL